MVFETLLILHYQVKSGVLFQNIGILLMLFMLGLAVGAFAADRVANVYPNQDMTNRKWYGRSLLLGFGILNLVFMGLLRLSYNSDIYVIGVFLFLTGFFVSGVFAYASLLSVTDRITVVSPLYAADLIGGCVGSLLGSLAIIPFLGMDQAALIMAVLSLSALLLI